MRKGKNSFISKATLAILSLGVVAFTSCSEDEDPGKGTMEIRMTDAPADNDEINAVFVTVTSVKVGGELMDGFEGPKTIDVMALQNGKTELLVAGDVDAETYESISLELDYDADEDGNMPGSYVEMKDGTIHRLGEGTESTGEYTFQGSSRVMANATSTVVLDFDLRKFIRENEGQAESDFSFASKSELSGLLHFSDEDNTGSVKGNYDGQIESGEKVVVYAYKKGTFNSSSETSADADIQFKNAVASTQVNGVLNKSFSFHWLEEGEYEFHFASYKENSEGEMMLEGLIEAESETNADLLENIEIQAGVELTIDIIASGIIG